MQLIKMLSLKEGLFINRPNRYVAEVDIEGENTWVHVHDPGRLKELLYPGNSCYVKFEPGEHRKTKWDMIAASKDGEYVLIHSGYHRYIAKAILENHEINPFGPIKALRAEVKHGQSRIDFLAQMEANSDELWIEVKGCSLSESGLALFPDAPTSRGTRHLEELIEIKKNGHRAGVLLLVLSKAERFAPNKSTDPKFYNAFYAAQNAGVEIHPVRVELNIATGTIDYVGRLPIEEASDE